MDKISVIVPIYNSASTLEMCLDSIIKQTYKNIEVLCINDASTDSSTSIVETYCKKDSRIRIINQEKNMGPSIAKSTGIKNATGKYIMFVDSDDYIEVNMINEMHRFISKNKLDFVRCNYNNYIDNKIKNINFSFDTGVLDENAKRSFIESLIDGSIPAYMQLIIINKDFIKKNNISLSNQYFLEDLLFYLEILSKSSSVGILNERLYNYINNSNGLTFSLNFKKIEKRINGLLYYYDQVKNMDLNTDLKQKLNDRTSFLLINFFYQLSIIKKRKEILTYLSNKKINKIIMDSKQNKYDTFTRVSSKLILYHKHKLLFIWFSFVNSYIKIKRKLFL